MIKRLILLTLSALLLFCGCAESGDGAPEHKSVLDECLRELNGKNAVSADYLVEITVNGATVYLLNGSGSWDKAQNCLSKSFSRTHLGYSVEISHYFDGETLCVVENGIERSVKPQGISPMEQFPCMEIISAAESAPITIGENNLGTTYSFTPEDIKSLSYSIFGGDISTLMVVMTSPLPEKTEYSNGKCTYTIADGEVMSCRYEYDVTLYNAPATDDEAGVEDSMTVRVSAKIAYKDFEGVKATRDEV